VIVLSENFGKGLTCIITVLRNQEKYSEEQIMTLGYTCHKEISVFVVKLSTDFNSVLIQRNE
jgi:hypothetical protein